MYMYTNQLLLENMIIPNGLQLNIEGTGVEFLSDRAPAQSSN
ncbi:MAG: hypothetical protein JWQ57_489 [Mucilaginibacter sp.]|nr:hypothetical protein [Mucilaginibacter sp.]